MTINLSDILKRTTGWCPNATEQKTRFVEYETAPIDTGIHVKKWKIDLLFTGHICALLFMSLYTLPGSMIQASDIYRDPNLMQRNHGLFLADVTISIASVLFSAATIILMYNIIVFKKLYSKLCFINLVLLSGLFAAIIVEVSFLGGLPSGMEHLLGIHCCTAPLDSEPYEHKV